MKKLFSLLLLAALAMPVSVMAAESAETVAREVAALMPLEEQMADLSQGLAKTLPEAKRPLFSAILKRNIDISVLRQSAETALVKTYTLEELTTMRDNKTQPGTEAMVGKVEQFSKEMQPVIDRMVGKAVEQSKKAGLFPQS